MHQYSTYTGTQAGRIGAWILNANIRASVVPQRAPGSAGDAHEPFDATPRGDRAQRGDQFTGDPEQETDTIAPSVAKASRLLIPIDATERSRWALRHAAMHCRSDTSTEVHLLFVAEPITRWEVLRFRTQAEIHKFQAERARWLLEDAAEPLRRAGIRTLGHFREGELAFEILDAAEQLGCERILLPAPLPRWRTLFSGDRLRAIKHRARDVRVVTIGPDGEPTP